LSALRVLRAGAAFAIGIAGSAASDAGASDARPVERLELAKRRPALLHAPSAKQPAPLVVFLHGMCALPEYECPVIEPGTRDAWLLCPPGPVACGGSGAMWTGDSKKLVASMQTFVDAVVDKHGAAIDARRRVLVGYSMGASAALRVVLKDPGKFQGLVIVNASVLPSAADLRRAGVTRVAFVAGARDRTAAKLERHARRLAKAGVDARFFALAKTGHYFDANSAALLKEPLAWAVSIAASD
jgi:predicted esterase